MLRLSQRQRSILVDKVPDTANLAIAGLVFGQFVGGQVFSIATALVGFATWVALLGWTMFLARKDRT